VEVRLHADENVGSQGSKMADALDELAAIGAFRGIEDPARWHRQIRQDRPLPDRTPDNST